ncbi:LysR family transcriptional regulator [Rhodobacteraceae bacterium 2376]|uniref:LysR family transcriptional regulator n=1 Tax=Rhabdonatronobacter sediminivivens TaxID=2743469 RepID=A0A7Z0I2Q0_9RHOB|nr:LysR family transcriptional regulator [Rhabdonatronobacter sediminivivens]NYS26492.1 LysR family transcriptional regulator [Rhabdonatronobacter sediminivivens]
MTAPNDADRLTRDLDWNLLRSFVVMAEARSITDAAQRLALTQPSVSTALKKLEDRIGKRLIDRAPGRYELTRAGALLYGEAVEIHGAVHRLSTLMRDMTDEVKGHVRIAVASHVVCPLFDQVLAEFHARHPSATLSISVLGSSAALASVSARTASFAICLVHRRDPKIEYLRLYREFFGLFCGPPHPLYGRTGLQQNDLAGHSAVSFETDRLHDALRSVTMLRAQSELNEQITGTSSHLEEVRRMMIAGLGIGPLPLHVVARDVEDGLLWRLPPYVDPPAIDVHLAWNPKATLNRAESALLEALKDKIRSVPMHARTYGLGAEDQAAAPPGS